MLSEFELNNIILKCHIRKKKIKMDVKKLMETQVKAQVTLDQIKEKELCNFEQFEEVNKIDDLNVAKQIIKLLLQEIKQKTFII